MLTRLLRVFPSNFEKLYTGYVRDLNRRNYPTHTFSDAYDLAQAAICFLCEFIGKELTDVYTVRNGKVITIKQAVYNLVCRHVDRIRRHNQRTCDIDYYAEELSVEIDYYEEKDYTEVDTLCHFTRIDIQVNVINDIFYARSMQDLVKFLDILTHCIFIKQRHNVFACHSFLIFIFLHAKYHKR